MYRGLNKMATVDMWSKQDFIDELQGRGRIPIENLPIKPLEALPEGEWGRAKYVCYYRKTCEDKFFEIWIISLYSHVFFFPVNIRRNIL